MAESNKVEVDGQLSNNMKNKNNGNKTDATTVDKVIIYTGNVMKQANINSFNCRKNNQEVFIIL